MYIINMLLKKTIINISKRVFMINLYMKKYN